VAADGMLWQVIRCPYYVLTLMGMCPRWLIWLRYTAFVVLYPVGALYGESKLCLTKHGPQVHQVPYMKQKKNITPNTYSYWTYYVWNCVGQAVRLLACWMYVTACDVCERGTWTFSFICVIGSGLVKCSAGDVSIVGAH